MAALSVMAAALGDLGNSSSIPLAFLSPVVNSAGSLPSYNLSDTIDVSWTTPYDYTTVWAYSADGTPQVVAANYTRDQTSLSWNASTAGSGYYMRLQKGHTPNDCATCTADSVQFAIAEADGTIPAASSSESSTSAAESTTSAAPSSTTSMAASTTSDAPSSTSAAPSTMMTSASSQPPAAAGAQAASSAPSPTHTGSYIPPPFELSTGEKVGIGLGVGLGIVGFLAFYACLMLLLKRRKARKDAAKAAGTGPNPEKVRPTSGTESFQSAVSHSRFDFEEDNGTLKSGWESLFGRSDRLMVGSDNKSGGGFLRSNQGSKRSMRKNQPTQQVPGGWI